MTQAFPCVGVMARRVPLFGVLASCLLAALPLASRAACFGPQDLGRGLTVQMQAGDSIDMRRTNTGLIAVTEHFQGDETSILFLGRHGLYFTSEMDVVDGQPRPETVLRIVFDPATGLPPPPVEGLTWSGRTTNIFADGFERPEIYSIKVSAGQPLDLSGCVYRTLRADIRYDWPDADDSLNLIYLYLPELDSAFLLTSDPGADPDSYNKPVGLVPMSK